MKIQIFDTQEMLFKSFADFIIDMAEHFITNQGHFRIVLSGGSSPRNVYKLLSSDKYYKLLDWSKVQFFFGDERQVPKADVRSIAGMADTILFHPLRINSSQIFEMNTNLSPEKAAESYMKTIASVFQNKPIHFDLILLGVGANAHTASLFPYTYPLSELSPEVCALFVEEENEYRITMNAPLINQAKNVAFLVYGEEKAAAVKHIIKDPKLTAKYPAQLIEPTSGQLYWFLDQAAARLLI